MSDPVDLAARRARKKAADDALNDLIIGVFNAAAQVARVLPMKCPNCGTRVHLELEMEGPMLVRWLYRCENPVTCTEMQQTKLEV